MVQKKHKYQLGKIRGGFTLIEMLVVIFIIGILAAIAVSSFGSARQSATLSVGLNSVMSIVKEQKGNAQAGIRVFYPGNTAKQTSCFGVIFNVSGVSSTIASVQTVSVPYVSVSPNSSSGLADYCDPSSGQIAGDVQDIQGLVIDSISQGTTKISNGTFVIMFKPPFGSVLEAASSDPAATLDLFSGANQASLQIQSSATPSAVNPLQIFLSLQNNPITLGFQYDAIAGTVNQIAAPSSASP